MMKINENYVGPDYESVKILTKIEKLIDKGCKNKIIPTDWRNQTFKKFFNIKEALSKPHELGYSIEINKQIKQMVFNLEKAINKSKV